MFELAVSGEKYPFYAPLKFSSSLRKANIATWKTPLGYCLKGTPQCCLPIWRKNFKFQPPLWLVVTYALLKSSSLRVRTCMKILGIPDLLLLVIFATHWHPYITCMRAHRGKTALSIYPPKRGYLGTFLTRSAQILRSYALERHAWQFRCAACIFHVI